MVLGPAWTREEMERPAGKRSLNSYTIACYTTEQQKRLGVNERGEKNENTLPVKSMHLLEEDLKQVKKQMARRKCGVVNPGKVTPSKPTVVFKAWSDDEDKKWTEELKVRLIKKYNSCLEILTLTNLSLLDEEFEKRLRNLRLKQAHSASPWPTLRPLRSIPSISE